MHGTFLSFYPSNRQKKGVEPVKHLRLGIYSAAHCAVDFSCALLLLGAVCVRGNAALCVLLYNFCAFALQMPLGLLADRLGRCRLWASAGCLLVLCAFCLPPTAAAVCAGVGNAAFHIGGGLDTLNSFKKAGALGIFVSPGALGLFLGGLCAQAGFPAAAACAVLAAFALVIALACRGVPNAPPSLSEAAARGVPAALVCLLIVVVLRSALGLWFGFAWKNDLALWFTLAVVLGKALGGLLADRLGIRRAAAATLLAAALLFVFSDVPALGLAAVFLFNTTMPMTLYAAARLLPGAKGFAFGLLTFALFLGFLPDFFGLTPPVPDKVLYAAGALSSLPLLLAGLRKVRPPC